MAKPKGAHLSNESLSKLKKKEDVTTKGESAGGGVWLPTEAWELLRKVSLTRALRDGGRASVSAVLADLIEKNRADFEKELKG